MNDVSMTDTTPRERRHQRTRDAILQAAIQMIREKGADKLSLRAIAREIDYSPAGLYEYFGSKEEIIDAVCIRANEYLHRYLRDVPENLPLDDFLIELGLAYISFARENPEMFTMLFMNMSGPSEKITIEQLDEQDAFTILAKAVQSGIESGKIQTEADLSAIEISYGLWALVHGMAVLQVTYLQAFPLDYNRADKQTIAIYIGGLFQKK